MIKEAILSGIILVSIVAFITYTILDNHSRRFQRDIIHPSWYTQGDDFLALDDHSRYIGHRMYVNDNSPLDAETDSSGLYSATTAKIRTFADSDIPRRLVQIKLTVRDIHSEVAAFSMREHASGRDGKEIDKYTVVRIGEDPTGDYEAALISAVGDVGGVAVAPGVTPPVTSAIMRKRCRRIGEVLRTYQGTTIVGRVGVRVVFIATPPNAFHSGDRSAFDARTRIVVLQASMDPDNADEMTLFDEGKNPFAIVDYKPKR